MQQVELAGIMPLFYSLTAEFQPQLDALKLLAVPDLRAILINSPSNPTGALFPQATMRALYAFAREHGLWMICDEAYWTSSFPGSTCHR